MPYFICQAFPEHWVYFQSFRSISRACGSGGWVTCSDRSDRWCVAPCSHIELDSPQNWGRTILNLNVAGTVPLCHGNLVLSPSEMFTLGHFSHDILSPAELSQIWDLPRMWLLHLELSEDHIPTFPWVARELLSKGLGLTQGQMPHLMFPRSFLALPNTCGVAVAQQLCDSMNNVSVRYVWKQERETLRLFLLVHISQINVLNRNILLYNWSNHRITAGFQRHE